MGERFVGTLAVVPLGGGAPRERESDIEDADWDRGTEMAIVRSPAEMGGNSVLEYPSKTKRYETSHSIRFPRGSRDGRRIAFLEDSVGAGEGGTVSVLDLGSNRVTILTKRWTSVRGLAWPAKRAGLMVKARRGYLRGSGLE